MTGMFIKLIGNYLVFITSRVGDRNLERCNANGNGILRRISCSKSSPTPTRPPHDCVTSHLKADIR